MKPLGLALLLPLFLLAGCNLGLLTDPDAGAMDFSWAHAAHGQWVEEPEVEVTGGARTITVTTLLSAPDPCQRLDGELEQAGSTLTLRVRVARRSGGCVQVIGTFRYTALIRDLAPGRYDLNVVHEYPGTGWTSGVVHEQAVAVD